MPYRNTTGTALYLNADKSRIVPEDSPEAAFQLVGENGEVSDEDARRYGLGEHAEGFTAPEPTEGQPVPSTAADPEPEPAAEAPERTVPRRAAAPKEGT